MESSSRAAPETVYDHELLKTLKMLLITIGAFPLEFESKLARLLYRLNYCYNVLLTISVFILNSGSVYVRYLDGDWSGLFENLSYSLIISDVLFKITIFREAFLKYMFTKMNLYEKVVRDNAESFKLYNNVATLIRKITTVWLSAVYTIIVFFFCTPFFIKTSGKDGIPKRNLIMTYWHPINPKKYYAAAYITEMLMLLSTVQFFVYTNVLICTLMVLCIVQLKDFQHRLKNITTFRSQLAKEKCIPLNVAEKILLRSLVTFHQNIIEMVNYLNKSLQFYLFFQFMLASFRITISIVSIVWRDMDAMETLRTFLYIAVLFTEICVCYGIGNEIMIEALFWSYSVLQLTCNFVRTLAKIFVSSDGIYKAVAMSDYDELSPDSRKVLTLILVRAKSPLTLSTGPYGVVSLEKLAKIIKTGYYLLSTLNLYKSEDPAY